MSRFYALPFAAAIMFLITGSNLSYAVNIKPDHLSAIAPLSDTVLSRFARGGRAVAVRGRHGGGAVAVRGPRGGGRAVVRGPHGGGAVAVRGPHRVGARYAGGVWYGTGRRYWHGRWWPYGVGSCWRSTDIGYVWVCQ